MLLQPNAYSLIMRFTNAFESRYVMQVSSTTSPHFRTFPSDESSVRRPTENYHAPVSSGMARLASDSPPQHTFLVTRLG